MDDVFPDENVNNPLPDRHVIQCNYAVGINAAVANARAYVALTNAGNRHDRIEILVRSRGGRWIRKWESIKRLRNFRVKALPPGHPLYADNRIGPADYDFLIDIATTWNSEVMLEPVEVIRISPDLKVTLTDHHVQLLTKPGGHADHAVALTGNYVTALHDALGAWLQSGRGRT